jgi:hypothetical protein
MHLPGSITRGSQTISSSKVPSIPKIPFFSPKNAIDLLPFGQSQTVATFVIENVKEIGKMWLLPEDEKRYLMF